MKKFLHYSAAVILLAALPAACAPQPQQTLSAPVSPPAPTDTDTAGKTLPPTWLQEDPTPTPSATAPPAPEGYHWLVVNTEQGLWMGWPDGSNSSLRIMGPLIVPGPLAGAISEWQGMFAYLTTTDPSRPYGNYPGLTLHIVSLPAISPVVMIPLTTPATEPDSEFPSDIQRAMVEQQSLAWSPEGGRLAFIGAQGGPSADLYVYDHESGDAVQLTDGPSQAYNPHWSPDGEWIVHSAAASFGTGAGFAVTGVYAARADDTRVISLYDVPQYSGNEELLGWLDADTAVMRSWFATCGPSDLRLVNLRDETVDEAFDGCLSAAAVGDGAVLLAQSPETAAFDDPPRHGLYLLPAFGDRTPHLLSNDDVRDAVWVPEAGVFLARTQDSRLLEVSLGGGIATLPVGGSTLPIVAPGGRYWGYASASQGIYIGEYGAEPARIYEGEVIFSQMLFSPEGDAVYFISTSGGLYRAWAPDWTPALVASGIRPASNWRLSMAWLGGG